MCSPALDLDLDPRRANRCRQFRGFQTRSPQSPHDFIRERLHTKLSAVYYIVDDTTRHSALLVFLIGEGASWPRRGLQHGMREALVEGPGEEHERRFRDPPGDPRLPGRTPHRTACVMFRVRGKPAQRARSLTVEVFHMVVSGLTTLDVAITPRGHGFRQSIQILSLAGHYHRATKLLLFGRRSRVANLTELCAYSCG
jgi:hypothetical protein